MLRETCYVKRYPNKSVVEDLITRTGEPTEYAFSPFKGKEELIKSQFSGSQKSKFRQNDFLEMSKERDIDPSRIKQITVTNGVESTSGELAGYRFLEDIYNDAVGEKVVENYITMLCVGYKKDNSSPLRKTQEQATRTVHYPDSDDDEDAIEEKYLQVRYDEDELTPTEYDSIIKELPYIIKSIWSRSKAYQANLFTFIFAYLDIVRRRGNRNIIVTDFAPYDTALISTNGDFVRLFSHADDNKYTIYPKVTKVFIYPDQHRSDYQLCMKFVKYIEKLGIDWRDENPLSFNKEFVDSLVVTYLPSNDDYFKQYKSVDAEIIASLKPQNVFTLSKANMYMPMEDSRGVIEDYGESLMLASDRIRVANVLNEHGYNFFMYQEELVADIVSKLLTVAYKRPTRIPSSSLEFEGNGFVYFNKRPVQFDGKYLGLFRGTDNYQVVVTCYGFLIPLEASYDEVYYLEGQDALKALEVYEADGDVSTEANWQAL